MYHNKVYIALGTNIGHWKNNFNQSVRLISQIGFIKKYSSIYFSLPYGYEKQNFFYNSALELETNLSPYHLLNELNRIEKILQKNKRIENGPRKIDLDIIFYNKLILKSKELTIPHYAAHLRDFVLLPLIEMDPFFIHPNKKETLITLYKNLEKKYVFKIKQRLKESLIIY